MAGLEVSYPDNFEAASKPPVIILFGWAGSSHRALNKYASIYKEFITIRYITPVKKIYFGFGANKIAAKLIVKYLSDHKLRSNPLFVHSFSNGGCFLYWRLMNLLKLSENSDIRLCGTIFDSCPAYTGLARFLHVYLMIYKGNCFIKYLGLMLFVIVWPCYKFYSILSSGETYMSALTSDPNRCPQLYLYSTIDDIIPYTAIEKHIKYRECSGVTVTRIKWEDSAHVAHLIKHAEEYRDECLNFVNGALDYNKSL